MTTLSQTKSAADYEQIESALDFIYEMAGKLDGEACLAPLGADGQPNFDLRSRARLTLEPDPEDLATPGDIPRLCVATRRFDKFEYGRFNLDDITDVLTYFDSAGEPSFVQINGPSGEFEDAVAYLRHGLAYGHALAPKPLPSSLAAANDNKVRFSPTWFDDIVEDAPKSYVIDGFIADDEFTVESGLPGSGKSVIATDAAAHVATGRAWHGRKVRQGLVVYIAAERKSVTQRRLIAFKKRHGVSRVPLLVLGGPVNLSSQADVKAVAATIDEHSRASGWPPVWIIADTLTRTFGPGDQNTSVDMAKYVLGCDELRRLTGAHLTVIHHTTWAGERGKGAIDLDGAVDATFMVKRTGAVYSLECTGANDAEAGNILNFTMESVEIATDAEGKPTTAPVVVPAPPGPAESLLTGLTKTNTAVLETLRQVCADHGETPEGEWFPDGVQVVTEATWRAAYFGSQPGVAQGTLKQRFNRAKAALLTGGSAVNVGQWFWVA